MKLKYIIIGLSLIQFSCKKLIEIDPPKTSLITETVFKSNDQATSAVTGIYARMRQSGFASGTTSGLMMFAGMSSDELINYNSSFAPLYENQLTPAYIQSASIYSGAYLYIYTANSILEGLEGSSGIAPSIKNQLEGETLFLRAFNYFYLVNLYGEVPLQLSSDYRITQVASKSSVAQVYQQIITDLKKAEILLSDAYPTAARIRVNKTAAQAMLARTYLYLKDWNNAEQYATLVIGKTATYSLVNYDAVFLANNQEAIWQLEPAPSSNANDGGAFIPSNFTTMPANVSLRESLITNTFEVGDKRKDNWVRSYAISAGTFYYPFKYKVRTATTATEYSTVLRLAEQYLIRAEAKINLDDVSSGIADINFVRLRTMANSVNANTLSGLSLSLSKSNALLALEKERVSELFTEWGHRWLDLKRWGKADAILSTIKPFWQRTDVLYPIPQTEIIQNYRITQNEGY